MMIERLFLWISREKVYNVDSGLIIIITELFYQNHESNLEVELIHNFRDFFQTYGLRILIAISCNSLI